MTTAAVRVNSNRGNDYEGHDGEAEYRMSRLEWERHSRDQAAAFHVDAGDVRSTNETILDTKAVPNFSHVRRCT